VIAIDITYKKSFYIAVLKYSNMALIRARIGGSVARSGEEEGPFVLKSSSLVGVATIRLAALSRTDRSLLYIFTPPTALYLLDVSVKGLTSIKTGLIGALSGVS